MIYLPEPNEFTVIDKLQFCSAFIFNDVLVAYLMFPQGLQRHYRLKVYTKTLKFRNNLDLMNQFIRQFDMSIQRLQDGTYIYCDMTTGHIINMDNLLFETILY